MIGEFGSSEAVCTRFLSNDKPFGSQSFEMMLKSVMAETDLGENSGKSS